MIEMIVKLYQQQMCQHQSLVQSFLEIQTSTDRTHFNQMYMKIVDHRILLQSQHPQHPQLMNQNQNRYHLTNKITLIN